MAVIIRARATLLGWSGAPGLNTWYFLPGTVGGSTADATDVLARVRAFWNSLAASLPAAMTVQTAPSVDAIDAATGTIVGGFSSTSPPTSVAGTSVAEFYAPAVQPILTLATSTFRNGRRVQGRVFVGPVTEAGMTSGLVSTSLQSAIAAAYLAGPGATGATASTTVVWSRPRPGVAGATAGVTGVQVSSKPGTLKSRRDG